MGLSLSLLPLNSPQTMSRWSTKTIKWVLQSRSTDLDHVALDELCVHGLTKRSRAALDNDASSLEGRDLGVGTTLATADNGTCLFGQKC